MPETPPSQAVVLRRFGDLDRRLRAFEAIEKEVIPSKLGMYRTAKHAIRKGAQGEKSVLKELELLRLPVIVLRDLTFTSEAANANAQIDFIVLSFKGLYVVEVKNTAANMTIDYKDQFIKDANTSHEASMYSPYTQNEHHIEVLLDVCSRDDAPDYLRYFANEGTNRCHNLVVLANSEKVLHDEDATPALQRAVCRLDQMNNTILEIEDEFDRINNIDWDDMLVSAKYLISNRSASIRSVENYMAEFRETYCQADEE